MSDDLTVERYAATGAAHWDEVVRNARARHFMFERAYMDYHQDRFVDASWYVVHRDRPIAVMPASRDGEEIVSHGGLTFGGLISGAELTTARAVSAMQRITQALRADGAHRLTYKPMPHIYHLEPAEEDIYALAALGARLVARDVTAALSPSSRAGYSDERRRALRRAAAADLELNESDSIEEFWALLRVVLSDRHGVEPVHSSNEMRLLADRFPGRIRLFVASENDEIVAGTLIFQTTTVAHAQYIASGARGRELSALDALFDHLLRNVYPDIWLDFGISNERDGRLNEGLMRNKEGYGARAIVHDRYTIDLH
jgi:hypothetical protein